MNKKRITAFLLAFLLSFYAIFECKKVDTYAFLPVVAGASYAAVELVVMALNALGIVATVAISEKMASDYLSSHDIEQFGFRQITATPSEFMKSTASITIPASSYVATTKANMASFLDSVGSFVNSKFKVENGTLIGPKEYMGEDYMNSEAFLKYAESKLWTKGSSAESVFDSTNYPNIKLEDGFMDKFLDYAVDSIVYSHQDFTVLKKESFYFKSPTNEVLVYGGDFVNRHFRSYLLATYFMTSGYTFGNKTFTVANSYNGVFEYGQCLVDGAVRFSTAYYPVGDVFNGNSGFLHLYDSATGYVDVYPVVANTFRYVYQYFGYVLSDTASTDYLLYRYRLDDLINQRDKGLALNPSNVVDNPTLPKDIADTIDDTYVDEKDRVVVGVPSISDTRPLDKPFEVSDICIPTVDIIEGVIDGLWEDEKEIDIDVPKEGEEPIEVPPVVGADGIFGWLNSFWAKFLEMLKNALKWFAELLVGDGVLNFDKFKVDGLSIVSVFPFCIPFDFVKLFQTFLVTPKPPVFTADFSGTVFGNYIWKLEMSQFESLAKVCRFFSYIFAFGGLMSVTGRFIKW